MNNAVLEYLEGYFGGELNESTSDEDIIEAFDDLLETANAVRDFVDEGKVKDLAKKVAKTFVRKIGSVLDAHPTNRRMNNKEALVITNEEDGSTSPSGRDRQRTASRRQAELDKKQNAKPKPEPKKDTSDDERAAESKDKVSRAHTGVSPGGSSRSDPYSRHDYRRPGRARQPITYSMRGGQRAAGGTTK